MNAPAHIDNLRLPRWLLPADWPLHEGVPVLAPPPAGGVNK